MHSEGGTPYRPAAIVAAMAVALLGATGAALAVPPRSASEPRAPARLVGKYPLGEKRLCCASSRPTATSRPGGRSSGPEGAAGSRVPPSTTVPLRPRLPASALRSLPARGSRDDGLALTTAVLLLAALALIGVAAIGIRALHGRPSRPPTRTIRGGRRRRRVSARVVERVNGTLDDIAFWCARGASRWWRRRRRPVAAVGEWLKQGLDAISPRRALDKRSRRRRPRGRRALTGILNSSSTAVTRPALVPDAPSAAPPRRGTSPVGNAGGVPSRANPRLTALPPAALGYVSVPVSDGDGDGDGTKAQIAAIEAECRRRRLSLGKVVHDSESDGVASMERPGLSYALERIASGEASVLVVSALERLSRSIVEIGAVFEWFARNPGTLVVVDHRLDTASPAGRLVGDVVLTLSALERDRLAKRRRRGRIAARAEGPVGGPFVRDISGLRDRIVAMRGDGMTVRAIADRLSAEEVPRVGGDSRCDPSTVAIATGYEPPRSGRGDGGGSPAPGSRERANEDIGDRGA